MPLGSTTKRLRVFATKSDYWPERLLCEVFWEGGTLISKGENEVHVHEVDNMIGSFYHAQQGFPTYARNEDGSLRLDARGKITRIDFRSRATHSDGEVLDALAENIALSSVYRVERVSD